jgi:hypothetical protein
MSFDVSGNLRRARNIPLHFHGSPDLKNSNSRDNELCITGSDMAVEQQAFLGIKMWFSALE